MIGMSATTEECWQKPFKAVREQFEIDNPLPEQENALRKFLGDQNIFVDELSRTMAYTTRNILWCPGDQRRNKPIHQAPGPGCSKAS